MTFWWGEPWPRDDCRAPVCENDAQRIETPVGEKCFQCEEEIVEGDRGTAIGGVGMRDGEPVGLGLMYQHIECSLRSVLGCYGNLIGVGHSHDRPYREDARLVQAWVRMGGLRER